jgi:hypothetical protein
MVRNKEKIIARMTAAGRRTTVIQAAKQAKMILPRRSTEPSRSGGTGSESDSTQR